MQTKQMESVQLQRTIWIYTPIALLATLSLFIIISNAFQVSREGYWGMQESLFLSINNGLSILPNAFWSNVTQIGDAIVLIPIISLLIIKKPKIWIAILIATVIASILSVTGKNFFDMPRPGAVLDRDTFNVIGKLLKKHNSLPSGHTITTFTGIMAIASTLIFTPKNKQDFFWLTGAILLAGLIGLSRVAVGAHWPFDVIVGATLGWLSAGLGATLYFRHFNHRSQGIPAYASHLISALLLGLAIAGFMKGAEDFINNLIYSIAGVCSLVSAYFVYNEHGKQRSLAS